VYADAPAHFTSELGLSFEVSEGRTRGWATVVSELCVPGTDFPRASVLLTFADIASGMIATQISPERVPVTVDLVVRILTSPGLGPIELSAIMLKTGRSTMVAETSFASPRSAAPWAVAVATFMASPREVDVFDNSPVRAPQLSRDARPTLSVPLAERVGVRLLAPGHAELEHRRELSNATNTIQGGLVALVAEIASESLAEDADVGRCAVHDLDVRYLRAARVGPAFTVGRLLHHREHEATARVEVRDRGADDRLVALVTTRAVSH
jgi:acyl-coenzyme A thioesterase PaaI-like protein